VRLHFEKSKKKMVYLINVTHYKTTTLYCIVFVKCQPNPERGSPFPLLFLCLDEMVETRIFLKRIRNIHPNQLKGFAQYN